MEAYKDFLQKPIVIYGAGYCGNLFLELLRNEKKEPVCFFDQNEMKIGKKIDGLIVEKPGDIYFNAKIVVCLLKKGTLYEDIKLQLQKLGYLDICHIYDLREYKNLFLKQKLILSPNKSYVLEYTLQYKNVYHLLEDELSKVTWNNIMKFITENKDEGIPSLAIKDQYFAYDIYKKIKSESVIDCGAFKGDVMELFIKKNNYLYKDYSIFEPDTSYNQDIIGKIKNYHMENVKLYNIALGDSTGKVRLHNYANENSVITEDGEITANCEKLDMFIDKISPTFIKIDVEGYEQKLIEGAKDTLQKYQPVIAIAIYHTEEDLWKIPTRLHELLPMHRFYIRSYMNLQETILYAVPKNRLLKEL